MTMETLPPLLMPLLKILGDGRFHSGQRLAETFGVSRATVCNVLNAAADYGWQVSAVTGRGYRSSTVSDWLVPDEIDRLLAGRQGWRVEVRDQVTSTNSVLLDVAASGAAHRSVVAAEWQSAGRGRRGRSWQAALGQNLSFSLLWRFDKGIAALGGLSLVAGLAVWRVLDRLGVPGLALKWPNDVLAGYRKLAGVLVEIQGDAQGPCQVVIGIGVNVRLPASLRSQIDQAVTDLQAQGLAVARNRLLADLLAEIGETLEQFTAEGFSERLRADWSAAHAYTGCEVRLVGVGEQVDGRVIGVDASGGLWLQDNAGGRALYHGGEMSLRLPRA
jgi:BirA family biotin operon repressor/biotin-[acetyl-CoA-carboxylase] ligase